MFSQHVCQNGLVYFNSSQQTCQRFHCDLLLMSLIYPAGLQLRRHTPEWAVWNITLDLKKHTHLWFNHHLNYSCNSVSVIISVLMWQQSRGAKMERVMREKKGERCRCGGKERRARRGGRHAWESCGRCLKTLKADDEPSLSHFPTRFPGLPLLPFSLPLSQWVCPHLPTHSSLPLSPCLRLRCSARVTPQHCSVISGPRAASSEPTNWT